MATTRNGALQCSEYGEDDKILPDIAMLNKLSFNGFHVTWWCHEQHIIKETHFPTTDSIEKRGFEDGFPNCADVVEDLYEVWGDTVGKVIDNAGNVLYDNMAAVDVLHKEVTGDY